MNKYKKFVTNMQLDNGKGYAITSEYLHRHLIEHGIDIIDGNHIMTSWITKGYKHLERSCGCRVCVENRKKQKWLQKWLHGFRAGGYQPETGLDQENPPQGGSGVPRV